MKIIVTLKTLLEMVLTVVSSPESISKLREYVLGYYYDEDEYVFDELLEDAFIVLSPYLEMEEAEGDNALKTRMKRLVYVLESGGVSKEGMVAALYYDAAIELSNKHERQVIDDFTYRRKLGDLTPVEFDVAKLIDFIEGNAGALGAI